MIRGRYQLGEDVPLALWCRDASGAPSAPNEAPSADIWSSSAKIRTLYLPAQDRAVVTGFFSYRLFLNSSYAPGLYRVNYRYRIGSFHVLEQDQFEILPGGDPAGAVIAMFDFEKPDAVFIVQSLDSGRIVRGKNPRL